MRCRRWPERGDPGASRINLFRMNSDWITYHTMVSTSDDQIAIAPGYLRALLATGWAPLLRIQHGLDPYIGFLCLHVGALCRAQRTVWGRKRQVSLEVYYDPAHTYNVDAMLAGSRAGS